VIDEAEPGSTFFKLIINFDAKTEDTQRDLNHREIAERVIRTIAKELNQPVAWVAAFHDDHTPLRHIHALAIVKARLLPVEALREEATAACLAQRRERDYYLLRQHQPEQGKEESTWERERSK
jgi:hypothetical protein